MMLDAELLFDENQSYAAGNSSKVLDLGANGAIYNPLDIEVKLVVPATSGGITSVKVQSSATEAFSAATDECTYFVGSSLDQTVPCTVAQFKAPIKPANRYVRLVYAGTAAGAKVTSFITNGVAVAF